MWETTLTKRKKGEKVHSATSKITSSATFSDKIYIIKPLKKRSDIIPFSVRDLVSETENNETKLNFTVRDRIRPGEPGGG